MTGRLVIYDWGAFGKTNLKLVLLLVVANDLTVLSVTIGIYTSILYMMMMDLC